MKRLKYSTTLRWMGYILIPVLVALLIVSVAYAAFIDEVNPEEGKDFFQTEDFAHQYYNTVLQKRNLRNSDYKIIEIGEEKIYYEAYSRPYYGGTGDGLEYIIVNHKTQNTYTNIKTNDIEKTKREMRNKEIYWNYENRMIDTSMETINQANMSYQWMSTELEQLEDYSVYTSFDETKIREGTSIYYQKLAYDYVGKIGMWPCYFIPILTVALLLIGIYLICAIGHEKKTEEIYLNRFDTWSYEWIAIVWFILIWMFGLIVVNIGSIQSALTLSILAIAYIVCYVLTAVLGVTTIKRIKTKTFFRSFFTYQILRWIKHKLIDLYELVVYNGTISKTMTILYVGFIIISVILASLFSTGIGFILLLVFWGWTWKKLLEYAKQVAKIKEALESIYQGKTDIHLEEEELKGILKQMVIYINDIAGGFSNAVEESLKSERLKTELITNVSHDIKTPLTSIINYVDLLKKEKIQDEKIQEYLEILDQKSQRLKRLTEDLVEASKVSSGNVTLNMEKINVKELMKQTVGEFKERFEEKNLQIELELPEEEVHILADNKYMYRVIENLYSNITKYALENSRVYLDVSKENKKLKIQMKNISKDKLNISADELMQRFVRGDKARTTDGSGLGLSISKSLTELQKGSFQMIVDGDLFKVELEFDLA